jgi:hypothetical protein
VQYLIRQRDPTLTRPLQYFVSPRSSDGCTKAATGREPHQPSRQGVRGSVLHRRTPAVSMTPFSYICWPPAPVAYCCVRQRQLLLKTAQRCAHSGYVNAPAYPSRSSHLPVLWRSCVTLCLSAAFPPPAHAEANSAWDAEWVVKKVPWLRASPPILSYLYNQFCTHQLLLHTLNCSTVTIDPPQFPTGLTYRCSAVVR